MFSRPGGESVLLAAGKLEVNYLVEGIKTGRKPHNDDLTGLQVVKLLEAADRSLKNNGPQVELSWD